MNKKKRSTWAHSDRVSVTLATLKARPIILENRFAGEQYDRFDALATTQQKIA